MLLGELCRRLGVPYRQARYVLEEDILPPGVDPAPDRGNHRQLTPEQAFWLGMVLKLKEAVVKTPLAATMASVTAGILGKVDFRKYDPEFEPFRGRLRARLNWYAELGDLRFIRLRAEREQPWAVVFDGAWFPLRGNGRGDGLALGDRDTDSAARHGPLLCQPGGSGAAAQRFPGEQAGGAATYKPGNTQKILRCPHYPPTDRNLDADPPGAHGQIRLPPGTEDNTITGIALGY